MATSMGAGLIRKDVGQGSSSSSRNYTVVFVEDNYASIEKTEEWLLNDGYEVKEAVERKDKIERVLPMLRQVEFNKDCFDPLIVAIGPYHHWERRLRAAEKFKSSLTRMFVKKCAQKSKITLHDVYIEIERVAPEAKECYDQEEKVQRLDSKTFAKMMLRDGCFILHFMDCVVNDKEAELKMRTHEIAFIVRDLFLLENQLPFQVLQALINLRFNDERVGFDMINKFIDNTWGGPSKEDSWMDKIAQYLFRPTQQHQSTGSHDHQHPIHLLDLLWKQFIDIDEFNRGINKGKNNSEGYFFRSVKELKTAGIHFSRSKSRRFTDVEYKFEFVKATLRLPPMIVHDSTKSVLLNLVAYEMCCRGPEVLGVASYIWLIDSLIDKAEDVQELRRKGILLNFLGSDAQVAELFNQISTGLVTDSNAYSKVKERIESHYENKILVWFTEWLNTHFRSPWTLLAFVGAIVVLAMSLVQTYYTVYPKNMTSHGRKRSIWRGFPTYICRGKTCGCNCSIISPAVL